LIRALIALIVLGPMIIWRDWLWCQAQLRYHILALERQQRRALSRRLPEGQVVWSAAEPAGPKDSEQRRAWLAMCDHLEQITKLRARLGQSNPAALLAARQPVAGYHVLLIAPMLTSAGQMRMVVVGSIFDHVTVECWEIGTRWTEPQRWPMSSASAWNFDTDLHSSRLALMSGAFDPAKPTEFTVPYTIDGARRTLRGHLESDVSIAFVGDGWFDSTMRRIDPGRGDLMLLDRDNPAMTIGVPRGTSAMTFAPDGRFIVVGESHWETRRSIVSGPTREPSPIRSHDAVPVKFSRAGTYLLTLSPGPFWQLVETATRRVVADGSRRRAEEFIMLNETTLLIDQGQSLLRVDAGSGKRSLVTRRPGTLKSAAGGRLAFLEDHESGPLVRVIDDSSGAPVFIAPISHVNLSLSQDGKLLAGLGRPMRVYDLASGSVLFEQEKVGDAGIEGSMIWSDDGRWAAASGRGKVYLWDAATWSCCWRLKAPEPLGIDPVAFSPDGRWLVVRAEHSDSVTVWDLTQLRRDVTTTATSRPRLP
jgi:WD40 repeat protein